MAAPHPTYGRSYSFRQLKNQKKRDRGQSVQQQANVMRAKRIESEDEDDDDDDDDSDGLEMTSNPKIRTSLVSLTASKVGFQRSVSLPATTTSTPTHSRSQTHSHSEVNLSQPNPSGPPASHSNYGSVDEKPKTFNANCTTVQNILSFENLSTYQQETSTSEDFSTRFTQRRVSISSPELEEVFRRARRTFSIHRRTQKRHEHSESDPKLRNEKLSEDDKQSHLDSNKIKESSSDDDDGEDDDTASNLGDSSNQSSDSDELRKEQRSLLHSMINSTSPITSPISSYSRIHLNSAYSSNHKLPLIGSYRLNSSNLKSLRESAWNALIDPTSDVRRFWMTFIFLIIMYNAIVVPLRFAFLSIWASQPTVTSFYFFDYFTDFFLLCDIFLSFHTPFLRDGILETDSDVIKAHYTQTWLKLDLISCAPIDIIFILAGLPKYDVVALRLLRCLRFVQKDLLFSVWMQYNSRFPQFIRFSRLTVVMLLIVHWLGCFWFRTGYWFGFGTSTWVPGHDITDESLYTQYIYAFWWATNVVTQVGGDPGAPTNNFERTVDLFVAFLSVFVVAVIIGNVNDLVSELNEQDGKLREKLQTLNHFMFTRRLPDAMQARIRAYYLNIWIRRGGVDDSSIMEELPSNLRTEISVHMNADIIGKVPIFAHSSTGFIHALVGRLKLQTYGPDEFIVRQGDIATEMFFIARGKVSVLKDDQLVSTISHGGFFGEIATIERSQRTASIKAIGYCDLFMLTHEDMTVLFKSFPAEKQIILHVANVRRAQDRLRSELRHSELLANEHVPAWNDNAFVDLLCELFHPINMGEAATVEASKASATNQVHPLSRSSTYSNFHLQDQLAQMGLQQLDNGELTELEHFGVIFGPHQYADTIYFVAKGYVDIHAESNVMNNSINEEKDEPRLICRLGTGCFFGAIALDRDDFYQVSAIIPYEYHRETIVFALSVVDLPAIQKYYEDLDSRFDRRRLKRAVHSFLTRHQTEQDYLGLQASFDRVLQSPEANTSSVPPTPRTLHQLLRKASRRVRESSDSLFPTLVEHNEEEEDETEENNDKAATKFSHSHDEIKVELSPLNSSKVTPDFTIDIDPNSKLLAAQFDPIFERPSMIRTSTTPIGDKSDNASAMNITISVSNESDENRPNTTENRNRPNIDSSLLPAPLERAQSSPIHSQIEPLHSRTMPLSGHASLLNQSRQTAGSVQPFNFLLHLPANSPSPSQSPLASPKSSSSPSPRASITSSSGYSPPSKFSLKRQLSIDTNQLQEAGNRPITPSFSSTLPGNLRQSRHIDTSPGKSPPTTNISGSGLGLRSPISQRRSEFIEASLNALSDEELLLLCNKAQVRLFARLQQANSRLHSEAIYH